MKRLLTFSILFCLTQIYAQDYSKIKIYINSEGLQRLAELGLPIDHGEWKKDYSFTSDFSAEEIEVIASNGFLFDVIHQD